ncbi:MAG: DUF819 family protein [Dethiosulfatibacter sp.]|nr:DUF819 family protein [Dethiosulfatibacter sp.]
MNSLVSSQGGVIAVITAIVAIAFLLQKVEKLQVFGATLPAILIGMLVSNIGIMPHWHDFYGVVFEYAVPISLTMMLLNVNIKDWVRLSKQPLLAMFFAILSVSIVTVVTGMFFVPKIAEGSKIAGMFVGTYTGGSANLTAIGIGLNASAEAFAQANAADYVIGLPLLIFLMFVPAFMKKSKKFNEFWPHTLTDKELEGESGEEVFGKKEWAILDVALLFAVAFGIIQLATVISSGASSLKIILITTIALSAAQFKAVREIKGNVDLGYFIAMIFFVVMGMYINISDFLQGAPVIILYCAAILLGTLLLHVILCKIFKIKYQYVFISIVAAIGNGVMAASMAGSAKWNSIMSTAIVLGAIGAALGNYIGIAVGLFLQSITGV